MGYVSNIVDNLANIVIQTEEEYRNLGYATKVVEKISRECIQKGIIPTYWVETKNKISMNVAKNVGFRLISKEIVLKVIEK